LKRLFHFIMVSKVIIRRFVPIERLPHDSLLSSHVKLFFLFPRHQTFSPPLAPRRLFRCSPAWKKQIA
jgi:hypothetical protein